jgi:large subunit ribosomal protein L20
MVRIKGGVSRLKRRKHLLEYSKGYRWGRKSKLRSAKEALMHAWEYSYRDRKAKKREFRALWQIKINAACRKMSLPYNQLIKGLKKK